MVLIVLLESELLQRLDGDLGKIGHRHGTAHVIFCTQPQNSTFSDACTCIKLSRISYVNLGVGSSAAELCDQERQM